MTGENDVVCEQAKHIVRNVGLEPVRVRSGLGEHERLSPDAFRHLLDGAVLGEFVSSFETQGLALAEALGEALRLRQGLRPMEWVLAHMSDAVCSATLYRIFRDRVETRS